MSIVTFGINHKTAPISVREQVAFDNAGISALQHLLTHNAKNEAVLLSTCNRTEIYTTISDIEHIKQWLISQRDLNNIDISPFCYYHQGIESIRHLMRVASGLDSMVLGEPQILGQIKQAYSLALENGCVGDQLKHLFPAVFATSKQVRTETAIGSSPVSLAYSIVQLAERIFTELTNCRVLLVGAGETIELVATHLHGLGVNNIGVANRTIEKATKLADSIGAQAIQIGDIPTYLPTTDVVITATASQLPILGKGLIESTLKQKQKKRRPLFMVDLAVPRDIEPEVGTLEDVFLYNIDDLQSIIVENLKHRESAAEQAEAIIEIQAQNYIRQLRVLNAGDIIRGYRERVEYASQAELAKAMQNLDTGMPAEEVLQRLTHSLTNKMLHHPTMKLREAAREEKIEQLLLAKELFGL